MQTQINEKLQKLIATRLKVKKVEVTPHTRFSEDLKMNVVTFMRLMKDVEESYRMELTHEEIKQIATVGDLQTAIENHRNGKK